MNKKISLGWVICIVFLTITLTFLVTWQACEAELNKNLSTLKLSDDVAKKVTEIEGIINAHYIEDISEKDLADFASKGFANAIGDKYAEYYTAEELEKNLVESAGKFTGIGISIKMQDGGYVTVTDVYKNSPADEAGIKIGDSITKINGTDVLTLTTEEISKMTMGKEGEALNITVSNNGNETDLSLIRTQFDIIYITSEMLEDNIGYIRISSFNEKTPDQFKKALDNLISEGAVSLIFDVRNNGGGSVDSIVKTLDPLIPKGIIATAKGRSGKETVLGESDKNEINLPMVVLTNSNTASAAELFCAALKDYSKCETVGMTTFGKGVMQETYTLSDGSAIKLTTAKYYTPKGTNYDGVGIKPDYEVIQTADEQLLIFGKEKTEDTQLTKAIEVISAKINPADTDTQSTDTDSAVTDTETSDTATTKTTDTANK